MVEFQNAWYVKQDPEEFRKFFVTDSPHLIGQVGTYSVPNDLSFPRLFSIAFIDLQPDPSHLLLDNYGVDLTQCLNKNSINRLCIVKLLQDGRKIFAGEEFLYVIYTIRSRGGFSGAAVMSWWVKRNGKWQVHTVLPYAG